MLVSVYEALSIMLQFGLWISRYGRLS
ncbi:putative holin-like toxin [Paenibacillus apiarius]